VTTISVVVIVSSGGVIVTAISSKGVTVITISGTFINLHDFI